MRTAELMKKLKEDFEKECIVIQDNSLDVSKLFIAFVSNIEDFEIKTLSVDIIETQSEKKIKINLERIAKIEIHTCMFDLDYYYDVISEFINDNIEYELRKV